MKKLQFIRCHDDIYIKTNSESCSKIQRKIKLKQNKT